MTPAFTGPVAAPHPQTANRGCFQIKCHRARSCKKLPVTSIAGSLEASNGGRRRIGRRNGHLSHQVGRRRVLMRPSGEALPYTSDDSLRQLARMPSLPDDIMKNRAHVFSTTILLLVAA